MADNKLPPLDLQSVFNDATAEQWREAAEALLKGAPYDKIMRTPTPEGVTWDGIYNRDDAWNLPQVASLPGQFPYLRGATAGGYHEKPWAMAQAPAVGAPQSWNKQLLDALNRGLNSVVMNIDAAGCAGLDPDQADPEMIGQDGLSASSLAEVKAALAGVETSAVSVRLEADLAGMLYLPMLLEAAGENLSGAADVDPLGELALFGELPAPLKDIYDILAAQAAYCREHAPEFRPIAASGVVWHEAGASAVQELAYALAAATAYLRELTERGMSADEAANSIAFSFGLGPVFFTEIAKLRAARMLWANVVKAFGGGEEAQKMRIHARTSTFHATALDPYVNMLRGATETFSGIVGAADSIDVQTFDIAVREATPFSRRMARNVHIILSEEAHFDQVIDPAGGSYFVEWLTNELAQEAWKMLQSIESEGGMLEALKAETPQQAVAGVLDERRKQMARRKDVKVGVNMYANQNEPDLPFEDVDISVERIQAVAANRNWQGDVDIEDGDIMSQMLQAVRQGATVGQLASCVWPDGDFAVEPATPVLLSEPWDRLRIAVEESPNRKVYLAGMGPVRQHKARMDWSKGFFESGGFACTAQGGFDTPEAAAKAAAESDAATVVLCSSDDTYPELVAPFVKALKEASLDALVVLAGYPKEHVEAFREQGVDEFIHIRANAWEVLAGIARRTGAQL